MISPAPMLSMRAASEQLISAYAFSKQLAISLLRFLLNSRF